MKTTKRFENAVMKLYNAFHENRLNGLKCEACAVGNMCDNDYRWNSDRDSIIANRNIPLNYQEKTGYSAFELRNIEYLFMMGLRVKKLGEIPDTPKWSNTDKDKDAQFKGLCAVVEYLAELDNIPNPMDYTKLFETENDKPIYELNF
jgi:hypothetical protein